MKRSRQFIKDQLAMDLGFLSFPEFCSAYKPVLAPFEATLTLDDMINSKRPYMTDIPSDNKAA